MNEKDSKAIARVVAEIEKIDAKANELFFYVIDTKGNASGSLEYIYNLALNCQNGGYNVTMIYNAEVNDKGEELDDEAFVGVGEWLGEEYASLKHKNINKDVQLSISDIVFLPEIVIGEFASDASHGLSKVPCRKVLVLQNYYNLINFMPLASDLGALGIYDCICNSEANREYVEGVFPYLKTSVINPVIDKRVGEDKEEVKNLVVNVYVKNPMDVKRIMNDFCRRFPSYKWITFMPLNGLSKEEMANELRKNAITVWADPDASYGITAIEAMKSGSIVVAKTPANKLDWAEEDGSLRNCCVWFDNFHELPEMLAKVIRSYTVDTVPADIYDAMGEVVGMFDTESTVRDTINVVAGWNDAKKKELLAIKTGIQNNSKNNK